MTPKAQQHFLSRILRVGLIGQQRARVAINLVTMAFTQDFEFQFTNHPVSPYNAPVARIVTRKTAMGRIIETLPDFSVLHTQLFALRNAALVGLDAARMSSQKSQPD